jgi:hypothetical protein
MGDIIARKKSGDGHFAKWPSPFLVSILIIQLLMLLDSARYWDNSAHKDDVRG